MTQQQTGDRIPDELKARIEAVLWLKYVKHAPRVSHNTPTPALINLVAKYRGESAGRTLGDRRGYLLRVWRSGGFLPQSQAEAAEYHNKGGTPDGDGAA